ncbi:MAG: glycoside hydrolase family 57 protein [bacterium]|nr:glycoside hydrolase family 57 protein [bacterium]
MKEIGLAFLWHMHQPYYYNPADGRAVMPWVRMHATRGYLDLISLLDEYPDLRQTFNYVPSLVRQIRMAVDGGVRDLSLECSAAPAAELGPSERQFILLNFFMVSWETMLMPYPRYRELLFKRGTKILESSLPAAAARFSERDIRDLQVWFNLAWFGFRACALYPEIAELRRKGASFTEGEKARVLEIQREILGRIIPLHREALERNRIELTTSPFYHPIMPLLHDTEFARRALPDLPLPRRFRHPDDVAAQLRLAVGYHEEVFGTRPTGLWPSEGSVCPEIVPAVAGAGIRWMASDEDVLFRSIRSRDRFGVLYKPYAVEHDGASVAMVFRDRVLSDRIGFSYAHADGRSAAADFLMRVAEIAKMAHGDPPLVSVILDGENAWQSYPDGGESFLRRLFEGILSSPFIRPTRIGEFIERHPPGDVIHRLHSGSWINSDYAVWIGEKEDNDAWDLLGRARDALRQRQGAGGEADLDKALEEIYAAEGSDWFWWYGDRFSSDNDAVFDELFRAHLRNAYALMGEGAPEELDNPIINLGRISVSQEPRAFLKPVLDGRESSYYEWVDAGKYDATRADGTMWKSERFIRAILYGFDERTLYLRIDPLNPADLRAEAEDRVHVHFIRPREWRISFSLGRDGGRRQFELGRRLSNGRFGKKVAYPTIAIDRIIELAVPFDDLGFGEGEEVCFYLQVKTGTQEWERVPRAGYISFAVPGEDFELQRWSAL